MFGVIAVIVIIGVGFTTHPIHASIVPGNEIHFRQQISRDYVKNVGRNLYGFKGVIRQAKPAEPITDCIFTTSRPGRYVYKSIEETENVCGIYVFAEPDEIVEISFPRFDVPCNGNNRIGIVDGWELNGQYFPSEVDHQFSLEQRSTEFCGRTTKPRTYLSSQNVALVRYRIPTVGKGFVVSIKFRKNILPCNVVASSDTEPFTLRNYGRRVNCTFVAIYPAIVRTVALDVGSKRIRGAGVHPDTEFGIIHQCDKRGTGDEVQIGGTDGLDTSQLEILDTICGVDPKPSLVTKTIGCEVTTIRLVSSGRYDNSVTIIARPADDKEILDADLTCGLNSLKTVG